jgi:hypothetical protein
MGTLFAAAPGAGLRCIKPADVAAATLVASVSKTHLMHVVWLLAPGLALTLLGAHFWRAGAWPLVALSAAFLMLLALPRSGVVRVVQAALVLGALEWLRTACGFVQARLALGQPWMRLAIILGAVALFTAAAAFVFRHPRLRVRYSID